MRQIFALIFAAWVGHSALAHEGAALFAAPGKPNPPTAQDLVLGGGEKLITILQTNDIHGGVEPQKFREKDFGQGGGMALLSGAVKAIRKGIAQKYGDKAGVIVLDGGDQFQGTLLSNFNEGQLVFDTMNEVGYDAAVPGNHDYDFGPIGWLEDQVTPGSKDQNPRGALLRLVQRAKFPLLSANTYLKSSLQNGQGQPVDVNGSFCKVATRAEGVAAQSAAPIAWEKARRPEFLQPYLIKDVAGLRVALIGLDNPETPTTTTAANVSDLCFRDEAATYQEIYEELKGKADIFVILMHDGNAGADTHATQLLQNLLKRGLQVDAVAAAHTHYMNNERVDNVPLIQSNSGGMYFGRIDLVYNSDKKSVDRAKTRAFAGIPLTTAVCASFTKSFCSSDGKQVKLEGVPVESDAGIEALIQKAREDVAPISGRKLGVATGTITVHRYQESPMGDQLADALRLLSGAEIAFMNTGGLRAPLEKGDVTYEDLFKVLPFGNHGVVVSPMGADRLMALLERSARTCGSYGALVESGLKVRFERNCTNRPLDEKARLLKVETLAGEVLFDVEKGGLLAGATRTFQVATLDFLSTGGSGYDGFSGVPVVRDLGIVREVMTEYYLKSPAQFEPKVDGRWAEVERSEAPSPSPAPATVY